MLSFWLTLILVTFFFIGRHLFKRWFNPIFLYLISWAFILYLYDLKLIIYTSISDFTWITVSFAFISFFLGCLIVYLGRGIYNDNSSLFLEKLDITEPWDDDKQKKLKRIIIYTSVIGLLAAIQHWYALIKEFGSFSMVLLSAGDIYSMRVAGEHFGKIPYLVLCSYAAVFLSAIYSAYRNKFTYLVIIPLIAVILHDAANLARAGVFFSFVLFGVTFITTRFFFKSRYSSEKYNDNKNIIITVVIVVVLAVGSVSLIKMVRNPIEGKYKTTTIQLKQLNESGLLPTSVYLYFSSPIAVLSKYLDNRDEVAVWGENTFYPIYNNLNKFGLEVPLEAYPKGYFVPMWVNSATYIRELDLDFGPLGILIVPFVIGFLSTFFWFKYFEKGSLIYLTFYSFTSILTVFSVFYMASRLTFWFFGLIFSILLILYFDRNQSNSKPQ